MRRHVDNIKVGQCITLDMTTTLNDDESFQLAPELTSVTPSISVSENPTPTDYSTSTESATSSRPVRTRRPSTRLDNFNPTEEVSEL